MKSFKIIKKDIRHSKNSLLVIFSVAFAVFIPIVIFSVSNSFMQTANEECNKIYGYFDNILYNANESNTIEDIQDNTSSSGSIKVFNNSSENNIVIGYIDSIAAELGNLTLLSGKYPETADEVAVCNSVIYKNDAYNIDSYINVNNKKYKIVGIINDYYAVWNKPTDSSNILLPNVIVSENEAEKRTSFLYEHFLIVARTKFSNQEYLDNDMLISNVNKINNNESNEYKVPSFVVVLTTICSVLLNLYAFSYYFENEKKKLAILRCFGLNKNQTMKYCITKTYILLIIAIPLGIIFGYAISFIAVHCFGKVLELEYPFCFSFEYLLMSVLLCLVTVAISISIILREIKRVSPLDLYRNDNISVNKKTYGKTKRNNVLRLAFLELRLHLKESIIIITLVSFSIALFTSLSLYMGVYSSKVSDVHGRMPLTFDYEFLTEQDISDVSYVDENGQIINLKNLPDAASVYYLMDHNKIISNDTIEEIQENPLVESVNKYLEVNDLFLLNSPEEEENDYLNAFINDEVLHDEVASAYNIEENVRGIQFFGYSEEELLDMESYVTVGKIDIEKIRSGEEVVLMAPIYEFKQYNGFSEQHFIAQNEYVGTEYQYKDDTYSVGDKLSFIQFFSTNKDLKGYLSLEEMMHNVKYEKYSVKIGAIIYERIGWFDNLTQPPTAYTLVGLNDSITNLNLLPTVSRIQIFLKNTATYQDFDPIIQYYQNELSDYSFRNNAAEMQDFREFQIIINTLCYSLVVIICLVVILILYIEDRITLYRNRKLYALLRLNGLSFSKAKKMIVIRAVFIATTGLLLSLIITLAIMWGLFGGINDAFSYINIAETVIPTIVLLATTIISPVLLIKKLFQMSPIQLLNE